MTEADLQAATCALYDWLEAQEIHPADSVEVMVMALAGIILTAAQDGADANKGAAVIAKMLRATVKEGVE